MYKVTIFNYWNNPVKVFTRTSYTKAKQTAKFYYKKFSNESWVMVEDLQGNSLFVVDKTGLEIEYKDRPF